MSTRKFKTKRNLVEGNTFVWSPGKLLKVSIVDAFFRVGLTSCLKSFRVVRIATNWPSLRKLCLPVRWKPEC